MQNHHKLHILPRMTKCRKEFADFIIYVCDELGDDRVGEWVQKVKEQICGAHYFEALIFIDIEVAWNPYLYLHEFAHHVSKLLRCGTQSRFWFKVDKLVDDMDIWIFGK